MSSAKRKSEKPNSELTVMQIFSKALTGGSEWYDKVNAVMIMYDRRMINHASARGMITLSVYNTHDVLKACDACTVM